MSSRGLSRRLVLGGVGGVGASLALPSMAWARDFDKPYQGYAPPSTTLRTATPEDMGLIRARIDQARARLAAYEEGTGLAHPLFPGHVAVMGHDGAIVATDVGGYRLLYANATTKLPEAQRLPMREDTVFDLASVSKLFTSLAVVQLVEQGLVSLQQPVATYVPEFASNGKQAITVEQLLSHTSGLVAWLPLWSAYPDKASRIQAVLTTTPDATPGTHYLYSDLNLITLGVMVERLTGQSLDVVVRERITGPLGMRDTGYNPTDKQRTAATEYQVTPARGMVWGEVHDENAWSLGGVAGHAGVFSTARDLSVLAQTLLNGGAYGGARILSKKSVTLLITNVNEEFPGDDHGLGFELNQRWYAEGLSNPREAGHTGYTGTSLVIDFASRSFAILLTNRVHPSRSWGSINPARRAWAQGLALAMPVRPAKGPDAWFTGDQDARTATLDLPVEVARSADLRFAAFVDTEETDPLRLEVSRDGGATWGPLPFEVHDRNRRIDAADGTWADSGTRRWVQVTARLGGGSQVIRWRHTTDALYLGRGVYVDDVQVRGGGTTVDTEKDPSRFTASGWVRSAT